MTYYELTILSPLYACTLLLVFAYPFPIFSGSQVSVTRINIMDCKGSDRDGTAKGDVNLGLDVASLPRGVKKKYKPPTLNCNHQPGNKIIQCQEIATPDLASQLRSSHSSDHGSLTSNNEHGNCKSL